MKAKDNLPIIDFPSRADWESWLDANHADSPGLWIRIAKKGSKIDSVTYPEALEAALCYGWIDGQKGSFDDDYWLQRFTRRGPRSKWSKINRDAIVELVGRGMVKPAGLREIEAAKKDGRWEAAYDSQRNMAVPDDFQARLEEEPAAREFFTGLTGSRRYAILFRIHDARRPETRARRIEQFIEMLKEGRTLN